VIELLESAPWLSLVYTSHDALKVACPVSRVEESWPVYKRVVQQSRLIGEVMIDFPGEFKQTNEDGSEVKIAA
jgi:hypothetical protein